MKLRVYTDGASRGKEGASTAGIVVQDASRRTIRRVVQYLPNVTSNEAEYLALIIAIETLESMYGDEKLNIHFFTDSSMIAKQLNGVIAARNPTIRKLRDDVREKLNPAWRVRFIHIPRGRNKEAHNLAYNFLRKEHAHG